MNLSSREEKSYLILIFYRIDWQAELVEMNRKKKEAKYRYPNSLIWLLATVHVYLLPYRQLEGFLNVMSEHIHTKTERESTRLYNNVVKSCKNKDSAETRNK
jgi:hypothetical protein